MPESECPVKSLRVMLFCMQLEWIRSQAKLIGRLKKVTVKLLRDFDKLPVVNFM